jgi:hypothetical protein
MDRAALCDRGRRICRVVSEHWEDGMGDQQAEQKMWAYLGQNKMRLEHMNVDAIIYELRVMAGVIPPLIESEVRAQIVIWRTYNGPPLVPIPSAPPSPTESKLNDLIKKASAAIEGVDIKYRNGRVHISVTGVTADRSWGKANPLTLSGGVGVGGPKVGMEKGATKVSVGAGWDKTLKVETEVGKFHFSGELEPGFKNGSLTGVKRWELKVSYPEDITIPDMSKFGKVFSEGADAMQDIASEAGTFENLNDIPRITKAISPHVKPVKEAIEGVVGIAKAKPSAKPKVSFGVTFGSLELMPGQEARSFPSGFQGQGVLTVQF